MNKESSSSFSPDWVRCKSKSRANKYYMFNKKTGETTWCPDSAAVPTQPRKTVSAKDIKTPAQDRLKRLQSNLQKKKLDEPLMESGKSGRHSKKTEKLKTEAHLRNAEDDKPQTRSSVQERLKAASEKPTTNGCDQTTPKVSPKSKSSTTETATSRKLAFSPPEGGDSSDTKANHKPSVPKFVIPKKPVQTETNSILASQSRPSKEKAVPSSVCDESVQSKFLSFTDTNQEPDEPSSSTDKSRTSEESSEFDENDNKKPPNDQPKSGFLSKLKTFYNKLVSSATSPPKKKPLDKEKQSNLATMSKPAFKPKKPDSKSFLRGILQENENGTLPSSLDNFSAKIRKVSSPIPVPNESANARLQRLRKSLHNQQNILYSPPTGSETSTNSGLVSDNSSFRSPNSLESDCEPMDWQPISDDIVSSSPATSDLSTVSEHYDTVNENLMRLAAERKQSKQWKPDHYYFVVDTNVFIDYLTFVDDLTTMKLCDSNGSLIYVPYCVLQELDKLKIRSSSESVKTRAVRAIKYLNKSFDQQNPRIQAQTAADEKNHLITVQSPDDSILNCCLQVMQHVKNLVLLTEDVNLQSKAMCNDILVSTKSDLISKH